MSKIIADEKLVEEVLSRGVENIYPDKESLKKLLMSGKQIKIYCGFDPTAPTLHMGNGIQIRKLAKFLELGHEVIFLFGDFTAQIGDPTDKLALRKPLTHGQVLENAKGYKQQISRIIDIKKTNFRFLHNEKWSNKLKPVDLLELASHFTVSRLLERDMFQERIKSGREIHVHEFLYPVFQAYDAVTMGVDVQIGGNDQMFNMLAGRDLMKKKKNKEMFVLTTKLLVDPTGKKMGKSEGNMITLIDSPEDIYGKVMSWTDEMITTAFEILTDVPMVEIEAIGEQIKNGANPRDAKMKLAYEVVKVYLGEDGAKRAEQSFKRVFQDKEKPLEILEVKISADKLQDGKIGVLDLFVTAGLAQSNGEMRRLIKEGAIRIEDKVISQDDLHISIPDEGLLLQKGKRMFARVMVK